MVGQEPGRAAPGPPAPLTSRPRTSLAELEAAGGRLIDPPPPLPTRPLHETVRAGVAAHGTIVDAIAASQAQHAELVAAGRESKAADLAEILDLLADLEATFPPAVHPRCDRNGP